MLPRPEELEQVRDRWRAVSRSDAKDAVQAEMDRILESTQFRTSHRGRAFLTHVVSRAMAGEFDALKERLLGVELFGKDSEFDTDRDSVVRVAASDVRRRLQEYYRRQPPTSVRISLRSGTYLPVVELLPVSEPAPPEEVPAETPPPAPIAAASSRRYIWTALLLIAALGSAFWLGRKSAAERTAVPPFWATVLPHGQRANMIMADANLVLSKVQLPREVPIDAYSGNAFEYLPNTPGPFAGYLNNIPLTTVSDAMLTARIASLAAQFGCELQVKGTRRLQLADLKRGEPLIFLGSAMSDPWVELLHDQMNFHIEHQLDTGIDHVINVAPRPGESSRYAPYRENSGVLVGYAVVTLIRNLRSNAPVLVIAGTSTESTEAAGEFVTDLARLESALKDAGLPAGSPIKHAEFLLRTSYMAASAAKTELLGHRVEAGPIR